jgi:hypothetical protein
MIAKSIQFYSNSLKVINLSSIKFYVLYSYSSMGTNTDTSTINWDDVIKKEARGLNNADLGRVHGLSEPFVVTHRGTLNKEKFYIPKSLVEGYDGITFV